jgi:uncharacterized phosphosugar-binding protein
MTAITDSYFSNLIDRLETLKVTLSEPMEQAAAAILEAARNDKRVYVFGTGHSHMLAEEVHYRAGGLAITVPVLVGSAMLHEGAVISSVYERTEGLVRPVLERYGMQPGDVIIIASNSGVNAAPIEAADYGREIGAKVIAITSVAYSTAIANGRRRLADMADVVLDNGLPPGDAVLDLAGTGSELAKAGDAPIYLSANMPGAAAVNQTLVKKYRPRNPHL